MIINPPLNNIIIIIIDHKSLPIIMKFTDIIHEIKRIMIKIFIGDLEVFISIIIIVGIKLEKVIQSSFFGEILVVS